MSGWCSTITGTTGGGRLGNGTADTDVVRLTVLTTTSVSSAVAVGVFVTGERIVTSLGGSITSLFITQVQDTTRVRRCSAVLASSVGLTVVSTVKASEASTFSTLVVRRTLVFTNFGGSVTDSLTILVGSRVGNSGGTVEYTTLGVASTVYTLTSGLAVGTSGTSVTVDVTGTVSADSRCADGLIFRGSTIV